MVTSDLIKTMRGKVIMFEVSFVNSCNMVYIKHRYIVIYTLGCRIWITTLVKDCTEDF